MLDGELCGPLFLLLLLLALLLALHPETLLALRLGLPNIAVQESVGKS